MIIRPCVQNVPEKIDEACLADSTHGKAGP